MNRNRLRRLRWPSVWAGVAVMALVGVSLAIPSASADVKGGYLLPDTGVPGNPNSSDPFVMRCMDSGNVQGYCLYTSQDMSTRDPKGPGFQMHDTLGFFSTTGRPGTWRSHPVVFDESKIPWVPAGANHEWAPGAFQTGGSDGTQTFLYVPNIKDKNAVHTSGKLAVAMSTSGPFGPFSYVDEVKVRDANGQIVDGGYMSDPEPFFDSASGQRYLVYADGDFDTCGGYKMGVLNTTEVVNPKELVIDGWPRDSSNNQVAWARCSRVAPFTGSVNNRPYLEGASLYKFADWSPSLTGLPGPYTLVFPFHGLNNSVPPECVTDRGEPNTFNSALAWAVSDSVTGPYHFKGILMCGSSTEWTNQASVIDMTTNAGNRRLVLIYHDGIGSGGALRQTHAECLFYAPGAAAGQGQFVVTKRFTDGFTNCMSDLSPYTNGLAPKASGRADPRRIVSARNTGSSPVTATQFEVSEWERFAFADLGNNQVALKFEVNGRYLSAATTGGTPGTSPMIADRPAPLAWETFTKQTNDDGSISLLATINGKFVQVGSGGQLFANLNAITANSDAGKFFVLHQ